jgi:hypothetical protein
MNKIIVFKAGRRNKRILITLIAINKNKVIAIVEMNATATSVCVLPTFIQY